MGKKIVSAVGIFVLIFLPTLALSFLAHTVFHQIILLFGILVAAGSAFYFDKLKEKRDQLNKEVFLQACELKKSKEALASYLATGAQTQAYDERLLHSRLTEECERAKRYCRPLSLLLVVVDSLAKLFQLHGPAIGEVIVQEVGQFLKKNTRSVDTVMREKENRFIAILPETKLNQAWIAAERVRYAVEKNIFWIEGKEIKVTVSIGFASFDPTIYRDKEDVLAALEKALARANASGSNRVATLANEME